MVRTIFKIFIVGCLSAGILAGCAPLNDIDFARRLTKQLVSGRYAARSAIDWDVLEMMEYDVGAEYSKLPNEEQKVGYQRSFIENFSNGFKSKGTRFKTFFNWRTIESEDPDIKIVAANCYDEKTNVLFFIVRKSGRRKLVKFQMLRGVDENGKLL